MDGFKKIVVIGASAGGMNAVGQLLSKIPDDLDAAFFIVLHVAKQSMGAVIVQHFQKFTPIPCSIPADSDAIENRHIYIALPDHHLIVKKDVIRINDGPKENMWRPSIDVLFRSAAAAYTTNVIGIVLSGMLDDGTSGMGAIKKCGGICIVQEPAEAEFDDMPNSVLNNVAVDYRVPVADMGYILADQLSKTNGPLEEIPEDIKTEVDITERLGCSMDDLKKIATHTLYTCPECGGGLWEINNDVIRRYRCHTGHVFNENVLLKTQFEALEESLWVSMRMLEERRNLLLNIAAHGHEPKNAEAVSDSKERADTINVHIDRLKAVLVSIHHQDKNG